MSKYECPNCGGGFAEPGQEKECPWCGTKMDKSYTKETTPTVGVNTTRENDLLDVDKNDVQIPPPDTSGGDDTDGGIGRLHSDPSTTSCPECGKDMPLVSWHGPKPVCLACRRKKRSDIL